jgi:hypothetical protein
MRVDLKSPTSWRPVDQGDEVSGHFVRLDEGFAKDGAACPIAVLRTDDGEVGVWLWHTVLRQGFARLRPQPGEAVLVRYLGKRTSESSGRNYHAYTVDAPAREPIEPDWSSLTSDAKAPVSPPSPEASETAIAVPEDDIPF